MTEQEPRCPRCDIELHGHEKKDGLPFPYSLYCKGEDDGYDCVIGFHIDGHDREDCIRQMFPMKLVGRRVREAVEACAIVAEEYGKRVGDENKDCWTITHSAAGLNVACVIRARKTKGKP